MIWKLPEDEVFIDGRMSTWLTLSGKSLVAVCEEILRGDPGWQQVFETAAIDWILVKPMIIIEMRFRLEPVSNWQEVWRDQMAVVYKRVTSPINFKRINRKTN